MLDQKYTGTIRHAIEFYGTRPTIPASMKNFRGFLLNAEKGRISFIVAPGTGFKNLKGIYSTDPDIQTFNKIFSNANKNINWKLVKTYDFADNTNTSPVPNQNNVTPIVSPTPQPPSVNPAPNPNLIPTNNKTNDIVIQEESSMIPFVVLGLAAVWILKSKKGKRKKK